MNPKILLTSLLFSTLFFYGCNDNQHHHHPVEKQEKKQVDTSLYPLQMIDNTTITLKQTKEGFVLKDAKEKLLLIDIYATWCPPCQAEAKVLSSLVKKYPQKLQVIGISLEENIPVEKLQTFAEVTQLTYPLATTSPTTQRVINTIITQLNIGNHFPIPLIILYKDGKVIQYYSGATEEEFIESDIKNAIGK